MKRPAPYTELFCARVRRAREAKHWTQQQAADALRVSQDRYRKWETAVLMPLPLIEPFCLIMGLDIGYLVTGHRRGDRRRRRGSEGAGGVNPRTTTESR